MQTPQNKILPSTMAEPQGATSSADEVTALIVAADKLAKEGQSEKAISVLDTAIALTLETPSAWRTKVQLLLQLGRADDALNTLDKATERLSPEAIFLWEKALILMSEKDYTRALEAFDHFIQAEPKSPHGWLGKGWSLLYEGNAEAALECAKQALKIDRSLTSAHTLCGDSLLKMERWAEAFSAFIDAEKHDPRAFGAPGWADRGDSFLKDEQTEFALELTSVPSHGIAQTRKVGTARAWR
jgi:tetratricopeptide (TPR) repeat protein